MEKSEYIVELFHLSLCGLLITCANSLDPDQDRQNVSPDLDLNCLTLIVPERFFKRIDFEKNQQATIKA